MIRTALSASQLRWLASAFALAFVAALAITAERPAQAQVVSCAGPAIAGSAVTDLWGESLGVLAAATTPLECDGTYYLIAWEGEGVALVAMPMMALQGTQTRFGGGKSITCGGPDDGAICKGASALISKVDQWRDRYGDRGKKKKKK